MPCPDIPLKTPRNERFSTSNDEKYCLRAKFRPITKSYETRLFWWSIPKKTCQHRFQWGAYLLPGGGAIRPILLHSTVRCSDVADWWLGLDMILNIDTISIFYQSSGQSFRAYPVQWRLLQCLLGFYNTILEDSFRQFWGTLNTSYLPGFQIGLEWKRTCKIHGLDNLEDAETCVELRFGLFHVLFQRLHFLPESQSPIPSVSTALKVYPPLRQGQARFMEFSAIGAGGLWSFQPLGEDFSVLVDYPFARLVMLSPMWYLFVSFLTQGFGVPLSLTVDSRSNWWNLKNALGSCIHSTRYSVAPQQLLSSEPFDFTNFGRKTSVGSDVACSTEQQNSRALERFQWTVSDSLDPASDFVHGFDIQGSRDKMELR